MQKICEYCKQPTLNEINANDKKAYLCLSCGKISNRFIESHGDIVSLDTNKGTKHITVGALIYDHDGRILMVKRRVWPYVYDFPAGHLDYNEDPTQATKREVLEETGLIVNKMELLYNGEIENDQCRYGANIHEWYFFRCHVNNASCFENSELDSIHWFGLEKIKKLDLLPEAKYFIDHILSKEIKPLKLPYLPVYHKHALVDGEEKQNELIYHISSALLKIDNPTNIINVAAEEILTATNIDAVSIFLKREDGVIECQTTKGKEIYDKQSEEIAEKCAHISKKVMVKLADKSLLALPMVSNGLTIGVIVTEVHSPGFFTERETQFLTIVTNEIAVGIANNRLVENIKNENNLLNSVMENSGEGILVVNSQGKILAVNTFLEDMFGVEREQIINKDSELFSKKIGAYDYYKKTLQAMQSNIQENAVYDEIEVKTSSGDKIWLGLITSFIRSNGTTTGSVIILRNITKEKELLRAKNDLITTATHELRTPLTAIKGYLSMLKEGDAGELNSQQIKYLGRAYTSTERLVSLVEDLLSTLKIEENKVSLDVADFNLGEVITESIRNLKGKAKSKRIRIDFQCQSLFARGDKTKSKHIIENLLDNAIKYTKNNGLITIDIKSQSHYILVSVKDNGVGIPEKYLPSVFDKFTRVKNSLSIKAGGTGLGLYIAKNLVEKQGGKIWLESTQKTGTTFYFTIPASSAFSLTELDK
jgi:PAS domain S-box-containing protein